MTYFRTGLQLTRNYKAADILSEKIEDGTFSTNADCDYVHKLYYDFRQHPAECCKNIWLNVSIFDQ